MPIPARYVHTNLIARDWRRLAQFYQDVFGCTPVPTERDLSGEWMEKATGLPGVHLRGVHLRLPGWGDSGPTLEIFSYQPEGPDFKKAIHRFGFGHIAFHVDDVEEAGAAVVAAGGSRIGQTVSVPVHGAGTVMFAYMADPEGNAIELQCWK